MGPHLRLGLSLDLGLDLLPTLARPVKRYHPGAYHPSPPHTIPPNGHPRRTHPTLLTRPCAPRPSLARLVDSEYEDYLLCGLTALSTLVKCLAPTVRADADADAGLRGGPVDVAREEWHERCVALQDGLRKTASRLQELAAGKGRPAQLSARLLKSLEKCGGAGRAVDARSGVGTDRSTAL